MKLSYIQRCEYFLNKMQLKWQFKFFPLNFNDMASLDLLSEGDKLEQGLFWPNFAFWSVLITSFRQTDLRQYHIIAFLFVVKWVLQYLARIFLEVSNQ